MRKRFIGLLLFVLIFVLHRYIPSNEMFDIHEVKAFSLMALCMILWFTEFIPLGASAVVILALPSLMGITTMRSMLSEFAHPILFFVIATFSLSAALMKVPLAKRMLLALLRLFGRGTNLFILAGMGATFLISSVMSNIPATAMFIPIMLSFLELYDNDADKKKTGRCMMICLAIAGMVGGIITPAGSSNNLIALSLLEQHGKVAIPFLTWMIICAPVAFVILPIAWILAVFVFRPALVAPEKIAKLVKDLQDLPKPDKKEIVVGITFVIMVVLWVLSAWVPLFDTTTVAIAGMAVMFLPGIDIFSWKEFTKEVSWAVVLMTGAVLCVGNIIITSGAAKLLSDTFFSVHGSSSYAVMIFKIAVFIGILQLLIPNGPAVISTAAPPIILAALELNLNPAILAIPLTVLASWTIIIPLSSVPLITYSTGYYRITDIGKVGIPVLIIVTLIMMVWVPWITGFVL
jgi:sodium-dependent dicarboxylate transporter 2/3/5